MFRQDSRPSKEGATSLTLLAYLSMSAVLDNSIGEGQLGLGLIVSSGLRRRAQYGKREKRVKSHLIVS